jgi:glutathione synthase/RimK-type ligase-like ATP-grasp enzyme
MIKLQRQTTTYTCGQASILSILSTLKIKHFFDEQKLIKMLCCSPKTGTERENIEYFFVQQSIPFELKQDEYKGGLALANIRNHLTGVGHYVVFLKRENDIITYFDPYYGEIISIDYEQLDFTSGDNLVKEYHLLFSKENIVEDFELEKHYFFLIDRIETLKPDVDTSLLMMSRCQLDNKKVFYGSYDDIFIYHNRLFINLMPVNENDFVFIRFDPNKKNYIETLISLSHCKGNFINTPQSILLNHDKHCALPYKQKTLSFRIHDENGLKKAFSVLSYFKHKQFVFKDTCGFGGTGIYFVKNNDYQAVKQTFEQLKEKEDFTYCILEEFIYPQQDLVKETRYLCCNGKILGYLDRISPELHQTCTVTNGAIMCPTENPDFNFIEKVARDFKEKGVFLIGIDYLNGRISEINTSCPAMMPEINKVMGAEIEKDFFEEITITFGETYIVKNI